MGAVVACAKAGVRDPVLVDVMAAHLLPRLKILNPGEVATAVWGLAKMGGGEAPPVNVFLASGKILADEMIRLAPGDLMRAFWAFAVTGVRSPEMAARARALDMASILTTATPFEVTNFAWSFMRLRSEFLPLPLLAVAREFAARVREFSPWQVVQVVWALGQVRYMLL